MLNFTVGPVQIDNEIGKIGSEQIPYFRTDEFSSVIKENELLIKEFVNSDIDAQTIFITGSGTASMEAVIMGILTPDDRVLVVNGGTFGQRFSELCKIHSICYTEINLNYFEPLTETHLEPFNNKNYTCFLVNINETSTGVYYDLNLISRFCKKNNLFLIVDAISSFLADPLDMKDSGIDVIITGSQKALACPPGISIIVLSPKAIERVSKNKTKSMYFDLKSALKNGTRGQTPFTPAVSILIQINARLNMIKKSGGVEFEIQKVKLIAEDFRIKIRELPLTIASPTLSNAVTPILAPNSISAYKIFEILKDKYQIWVCPNGGELSDKVFRVGHIGALTVQDNEVLINALKDMQRKGVL